MSESIKIKSSVLTFSLKILKRYVNNIGNLNKNNEETTHDTYFLDNVIINY